MMVFQGKIPFYLPAEKSSAMKIKIQESKSALSEKGSANEIFSALGSSPRRLGQFRG